MAHIIPFSDSHVENERTERDAAFVIQENQEMNHVSGNIPIKSPVKEQQEEGEGGNELEPYETMRHKVKQLMLDLFPDYCADNVKIYQMRDGRHNRIVGVRLCKKPPGAP
jgi:hypothetical protein